MLQRLEVRADIVSCDRCEIASRARAPVPFVGPTPNKIAVLGEAPGKEEDKKGRPFCGPAGRLLQEVLAETGWDPYEITYINTVSCWPTRTDGRGRTPSPSEINACSDHRERQLQLTDARWIVVTGNVPLKAYRPDLRIGKMHGRPLLKEPNNMAIVLLPVYHPAAVLRNPAWRKDLQADLTLYRKMVEADDWAGLAPDTCVVCGVREEDEVVAWHWDSQAVPYCDLHWKAFSPEGRCLAVE